MTHSVVFNADIFPVICQSLPQESLSTLARTAKVLQGSALQELWRSITRLSHLLFPLGSSVDRSGEKMHFSYVPTTAQWDRFRFYAQYVWTLQIERDDIELSSLAILIPHQPLLPRLKSLIVSKSWTRGALSTLPMFFVSSMQKFEIRPEEEELLSLESLVATLAITVPALRELGITLVSDGQWEFGSSISLFRNLFSINIPLTNFQAHSVLSHLSAIPTLSKIKFFLTESFNFSGNGPIYSFPAARDLIIDADTDFQSLHFMTRMQFDNLTTLDIYCGTCQNDVDSLFNAIAISCGPFLEQIYICGSRADPALMKSFSAYPLSKFTNLHSFSLLTQQTFWPTNEDIPGIAKSWPNLKAFHVHPLEPDNLPPSPLTMIGVLLLIEKCTSLMNLSLSVDAKNIPNSTSLIDRSGLTIIIYPDYSPIDCPKSLVDFLSLVLPEIFIEMPDTDNESKYRTLWQEVITLYEYFIKGQEYVQDHAAKETKELQMALDACRRENAHLRTLIPESRSSP